MLSVQKLTQDGDYIMNFHPQYGVIQENKIEIMRGLGKSMDGLYHLENESVQQLLKRLKNGDVTDLKMLKKFLKK